MKTFFADFPKVPVRIQDKVIRYDDYFRFVDVNELYLNSFNNYNLYEIQDGERPDNVSMRLYDTTDFYWTLFIVNDHLKSGMKAWPLSNSQLDRSILNEYGEFGICEMMPKVLSLNVDLMDGGVQFDLEQDGLSSDLMDVFGGIPELFTMLHGLDVSHAWLRVYRSDSTNSHKGARIEKYDSSRWQLVLKDIEDPGFFESNLANNEIHFKLINPYQAGTPEYVEVEESNAAWLAKTMQNWYPYYFGAYIGDPNDIQAEIESRLVFDVRKFHPMAENAPDHYYNATTGEVLSNIEAQIGSQGVPQTFQEVEIERNDEKRKIKVLHKRVIRGFVNKYNDVLTKTSRLNLEK